MVEITQEEAARIAREAVAAVLADRAPDRRFSAKDRDRSLTPRQLEVLQLVADGYTDSQLGPMLGISKETARTHMASVLSRLGVKSRAQAVAIGFREGWLR